MKVLIARKIQTTNKNHLKKCAFCKSIFLYNDNEILANDIIQCPICKNKQNKKISKKY